MTYNIENMTHSLLLISLKCCILYVCVQRFFASVEPFPVRLTGGRTLNSGRLSVYMNDEWGTVDSTGFNENCAKVACRDLGYRGYSALAEPMRGTRPSSRVPVWLQNVRCSGDELGLQNCSYTTRRVRYYNHARDISILCLNKSKSEVPLRLADGLTPNSGRLEIDIGGGWQSVCRKEFDRNVATVACRNMGYRGASGILAYLELKTHTTGIRLGKVKCKGTESYLLECASGRFTSSSSCSYEVFEIICTNQSTDSVPLRLINGRTVNSGSLEIQLDGSWGKICPSDFDLNVVNVACRSMGYSGISAKINVYLIKSASSTWWLSSFNCNGTESHLLDCPYSSKSRRRKCRSSADIVCTNHTTEEFPVRLTESVTPHSGRLEIKIGGFWGTVCNKGFDIKDADIACRRLKYSGADGARGVMERRPAFSGIPVWILSLDSTGMDTISFYSQNGTCDHYHDVAVRCRPKTKHNFPIRLVEGESSNSGRLEMRADDVWGTICKDDFGQAEGDVACRQLGYWKSQSVMHLNPTTLQTSVPVLLDNVKCDGSESHLIECSHNGLGVHNCSHVDDVAIKCFNRDAVSARLHNGIKPNMGRLEIQIGGIWGTVCNKNFDYKDATVACKMLGYIGAYDTINGMDQLRYDSVLSIWLDNLNCNGSETHLLDCPHSGIVHNCTHMHDIGLKCLTNDPVSARLMHGLTPNSGRLELKIDGVWGTVSNRGFGKSDAAVACRMLGYNGLSNALSPHLRQKAPKLPVWMYDMRCSGTESSLFDCPHELHGHDEPNKGYFYYPADDVSIMCLDRETTQRVAVRLLDGTKPGQGRLEIQLDGLWGTVSGLTFDTNAATVACRMLHYTGTSHSYQTRSPQRSGSLSSQLSAHSSHTWLRELKCNGTETSLLDCDYTVGPGLVPFIRNIYIECSGTPTDV